MTQQINVDPLIGKTIADKYQIIDLIGAGGMGKVYKAKQIMMDRLVAIKILPNELTKQKEAMKRFTNEARTVSRIKHENVVAVTDFGLCPQNEVAYLVMEYLEGESLSKILNQEYKLDIERSLKIFLQVCAGLAEAHQLNIVHRDIKPSNIILLKDKDGSDLVKIIDFGIAKVCGPDAGLTLTATNETVGSPHYMSPEQCSNKKVDNRSDIYSLGCLIYQTVSGTTVFNNSEFAAVLLAHMTDAPPELKIEGENNVLIQKLSIIISKCLAKSPNSRYQNIGEMSRDLERLLLFSNQLNNNQINRIYLISTQAKSLLAKQIRTLQHLLSQKLFSTGTTIGTVIIISIICSILIFLCGFIFLKMPYRTEIAERQIPFVPLRNKPTNTLSMEYYNKLWRKIQGSQNYPPETLERSLQIFMEGANNNKSAGNYSGAHSLYSKAEHLAVLLKLDQSALFAEICDSLAECCLCSNLNLLPPNKGEITYVKEHGKFVSQEALRQRNFVFTANAAEARDRSLVALRKMKNLGKLENSPPELLAIGFLAMSFDQLFAYADANGDYDKFVRLSQTNNLSAEVPSTQLILLEVSAARFYLKHKQAGKAQFLLREVGRLLEETNLSSPQDLAALYNDLGLTEELLGQNKEANLSFMQAYHLISSSRTLPRKVLKTILNNLYLSDIKSGDYRSAVKFKLEEFFGTELL